MKSNTLLFECRFGHFPPDLFQVIHISSENDCLSGCYQYCIELIVPKHIHIDSFIQLPVQLCVYPESTTRPRLTKKVPLLIAQGQVTHYETRHHGNTNGYHVRIDVASWFSQLHKKAHSRVFVDKTPEEITTSIFKENNITPHQWRWHISSNHRSTTRLPLLLQLNEDDATFLQRLWATQDTAFVFEHTESKSILHIASTDKLASICTWQTSSNITYCPPKGMGRQTDVAVDWSYTLQSDNTPSLVLKTLRTDIQVGQAIRFTEPEHDWLSGEYWVIARHIQGNFSDQQSTLDYCCDLTLIPRNSRFSAPQLVTPVYPGLKTAYIDTASPHLDEMGAYIIRFPFDNRDISAGPGSNRVRFATPFGGEGYGWHFPLRPGTQVVVTLKNTPTGGHEATIVGTLPNAENPAPADTARPSCHRLRSYQENTFEADDNPNTGYTALFTHQQNNEVRITENTLDNSLLFTSKKQAIHLFSGQNLNIDAKKNTYRFAQQNIEHTINGAYTLLSKKNIDITSHEARLNAEKDLRIMSETDSQIQTQRLRWSAKKIFSLTANDSIECWTEDYRIQAANIHVSSIGDTPFFLNQGNTQCQLDASGITSLYAKHFLIEAPNIAIHTDHEQTN